MYINNISVNTRHNRPSVLSRTALLTYFINDGQYVDPDSISAVTIFKASDNWYPSSVIGEDNTILSSVSGSVLMNFANSSADTTDSSFDPSNYSIGSTGIFRIKEGVYAVVLDSSISTFTYDINIDVEAEISNKLSATGDYIDVWSVIRVAGSDLDSIINEFTLNQDRFINVTEPLIFRTATRLSNRYVTLGSKINLKFTNEITIENSNIDRSVLNLFKDSLILDPMIEIFKENNDRNLPARVSVSSFEDTSSVCEVTSDNTIIFNWDTNDLKTHAELLAGNLGSMTGNYTCRVKFNILDQVVYSNLFSFIVS